MGETIMSPWKQWTIVEKIGQGSYGSVYKAVRQELGNDYYSAIKHIAIPSDPCYTDTLYTEGLVSDKQSVEAFYEQALRSIIEEINTSYRLKGNSNIVGYEDHMVVPKTDEPGYDLYIRMELLESLGSFMKHARLSQGEVIHLGKDICSALIVLERENILHRDIKPDNIFISPAGDYKIGDFGVARQLNHTVSNMSVKGTFDFMAPELQKGEAVNHTSDIYSLGIVLYRLCNGNRKPFLPPPPTQVSFTENDCANERRLRGDALPPPAMASSGLAEIILKACAYLPADRYQTSVEMAAKLNALSSDAVWQEDIDQSKTVGIFEAIPSSSNSNNPPLASSNSAYAETSAKSGGYAIQDENRTVRQAYYPSSLGSYQPSNTYNSIPQYQPTVEKNNMRFIKIVAVTACLCLLAAVSVMAVFLLGNKDNKQQEVTPSTEIVNSEKENQTLTEVVPTPKPVEDEYLLTGSDSRYIEQQELDALTWEECCLARNEIYARHGRQFLSPEISDYFNAQSWYSGTISPGDFDSNVSNTLNQFEKYNISLISSYEKTYYGRSFY